jgi:pimeloyl-ACP methyl ester carboxylesterase
VAAPRAEPREKLSAGARSLTPQLPVTIEDDSGKIAWYRSQDSLRLAARIFGGRKSPGLPLLCLPGLSRNSRDFIRLGTFFSRHPEEPRRVIALDYRGRGLSDRDPNWRNYTLLVEAQDVLAAAAALGMERAILIGTSRGGIIAMILGALRPALIAGVVLNDIGPVIEGIGLARIKSYLTTHSQISSWSEAARLLHEIGGSHFPAVTPEDWDASAKAYFVETSTGLVPDFDASLLKALEDSEFPEKIPVLWPQFMSLHRVPVLAIRGEFSDVLSSRTLAAMADRHPQFEQLTVQGQGHAPLLRDLVSLERIAAFARRCEIPGVF